MYGTSSSVSGWQWIWGCNWISFPSVTTADHVFKMDIMVTKQFGATYIEFFMEFGGNRLNLGAMGLTSPATETTTGWVTVTFDLAGHGFPDVLPSGGEWGLYLNYADGPIDISGMYVDNLRFEHK